jgi:hypothetical protein
MRQITDWLDELGLSQYAQRFAENNIDFALLRDLTDQEPAKAEAYFESTLKIARAQKAKS